MTPGTGSATACDVLHAWGRHGPSAGSKRRDCAAGSGRGSGQPAVLEPASPVVAAGGPAALWTEGESLWSVWG